MESQYNSTREANYPLEYEFYDNLFNYAFAEKGAIYSLDHQTVNYPQYMRFQRNHYEDIYCLDSAIMKAEVFGTGSTSQLSIHNYTDETLIKVQNGAFSYTGKNNELLTYFYGLNILDSYGVTLNATSFSVSTIALFQMEKTYIFSMKNSTIQYTTSDPLDMPKVKGSVA